MLLLVSKFTLLSKLKFKLWNGFLASSIHGRSVCAHFGGFGVDVPRRPEKRVLGLVIGAAGHWSAAEATGHRPVEHAKGYGY